MSDSDSPSPAAAAASASASRPRRSHRRVMANNKLNPVMFSRGLKALCDDPEIQETLLRHMRKVTSPANMKLHYIMRSLMRELLSRGKLLLRHVKKAGLDISTLRTALRLMLPNDALGIVAGSEVFAMQRVQQYQDSIALMESKIAKKAKKQKKKEEAAAEAVEVAKAEKKKKKNKSKVKEAEAEEEAEVPAPAAAVAMEEEEEDEEEE